MGDDKTNFDDEFHRAFTEIGQIRKMVKDLQEAVASLEKRMLLRVRGNQHCRVCTHHPIAPNPPISEWEQKYHDANHAIGQPANALRSLSAFPPPSTWEEVEALAAANTKR